VLEAYAREGIRRVLQQQLEEEEEVAWKTLGVDSRTLRVRREGGLRHG